MDRLWAPWRMQYIQGIHVDTDSECIFCAKPKQDTDRDNLIIYRGKHSFVILNLFPYNNGHLMVVPYCHTSDFTELDRETSLELWELLAKSKHALDSAFHPDGFNIGMNVGRIAGAGIAGHVHMHLVPRWSGDTNFMPVTGGTKVVSQGIFETYDQLYRVFVSPAA